MGFVPIASGAVDVVEVAMASAAPPRSRLRRPWTIAIDRLIGRIVEPLAAILLLVEVVILSTSVFSRYVLGSAVPWGDELASMLLLWLTMLGVVSAYRANEHMCFGALLQASPPRRAEVFEALGTTIVAVFSLQMLVAILLPTPLIPPDGLSALGPQIASGDYLSGGYLFQELIDLTPALQVSRAYVVLGLVVGFALILLLAVLRLIDTRPRVAVPVLAAVAAVGVAAFLAGDAFTALGNYNLIVFFVLLAGGAIAIGIPVAFAFGIATSTYLLFTTQMPLSVVAGQIDDGMTNIVLLAIPLFVLLGFLIEAVGIARRLVEVIAAFVGHYRGGLNIVLVVAMFLVSGISGSKLADMAAVTPVLFPEMERRGYKRSEMIALLSTSGAMAELIPPSLILIVIGTVCNLSIQSLFTGGLLPAAVASLFLIGCSVLRSRKGTVGLPRADARTRLRALATASPGLTLPLLIRYFVVAGIATATEVSTVGVLYSVVVGLLVYREYDWRRTYPMLVETVRLTGAILFIIATATAMGWALTQSGFAAELSQALRSAPGGVVGFVIASILLFMILGSVLEGIPAIVLFGPLLFPLARTFGINEIHYAVIAVLSLSIGLFAPPFGVGYYGACAVGRCDPSEAAVPIIRYLLALVAALALIAAVPWISTAFL